MSLVKKLVIIYCAENLISGKKYVGQTVRPLKIRVADHYYKTVKSKHKFGNALNHYPKDAWKWYILAEVELERADEFERFFIADLDTYRNGYNSTKGGSLDGEISPTYNHEICNVYNPEFGVVSGTRSELARLHPELSLIRRLINGTQKYIGNWVLAENKDSYVEFISGRRTPFAEAVTLIHPEHGVHTLFQRDFHKTFGLSYSGIAKLIRKKRKTHKGWALSKDTF